jgi:hypothetical protein
VGRMKELSDNIEGLWFRFYYFTTGSARLCLTL